MVSGAREAAAAAFQEEGGTHKRSGVVGSSCWQRQSTGQSVGFWQVRLQK
ncbi:hypothetical protein [Corallococcus sp. AB011P]|nr:hypothetical protein [Corallococcus sp. AB011P]